MMTKRIGPSTEPVLVECIAVSIAQGIKPQGWLQRLKKASRNTRGHVTLSTLPCEEMSRQEPLELEVLDIEKYHVGFSD